MAPKDYQNQISFIKSSNTSLTKFFFDNFPEIFLNFINYIYILTFAVNGSINKDFAAARKKTLCP